jgi:beta-lactamase superfamily II metal-dependent hydrolase
MSTELPTSGIIYWPVGCGDSSTISIKPGVVMQIDIHHMVKADDESDPATPIVDELLEILPKKNNKPYLAVFALTHPDQDHVKGFGELLKNVTIGELWFSPNVFDEYKKDLCDDAVIFREEADRRVKACIKGGENTKSGDRIVVIGWAEVLKKEKYKDLSMSHTAYPGHEIFKLDGDDCAANFRAFIHAPFKDDCADGDRNDTSLAMQITLINGDHSGKALFFGDLSYPTLKRIYEVTTDPKNLEWNVLLSPHHCSKSAMFEKDGEEEVLRKDILKYFEKSQLTPNRIISSSTDFPEKDEPGKNPPHVKARVEYEQITDEFLVTHTHVDSNNPHPIVFKVTSSGLDYLRPRSHLSTNDKVATAISSARGTTQPPQVRVGFGGK